MVWGFWGPKWATFVSQSKAQKLFLGLLMLLNNFFFFMFPLILSFDFDLELGSFFNFLRPNGLFVGIGFENLLGYFSILTFDFHSIVRSFSPFGALMGFLGAVWVRLKKLFLGPLM